MSAEQSPLLELDAVSAGYGPVQALSAVSIRVMPGEIVTLIGANGAGKTTLLRAISGLLRPQRGAIRLEGETQDLTRLRLELGRKAEQLKAGQPVTVSPVAGEAAQQATSR